MHANDYLWSYHTDNRGGNVSIEFIRDGQTFYAFNAECFGHSIREYYRHYGTVFSDAENMVNKFVNDVFSRVDEDLNGSPITFEGYLKLVDECARGLKRSVKEG